MCFYCDILDTAPNVIVSPTSAGKYLASARYDKEHFNKMASKMLTFEGNYLDPLLAFNAGRASMFIDSERASFGLKPICDLTEDELKAEYREFIKRVSRK